MTSQRRQDEESHRHLTSIESLSRSRAVRVSRVAGENHSARLECRGDTLTDPVDCEMRRVSFGVVDERKKLTSDPIDLDEVESEGSDSLLGLGDSDLLRNDASFSILLLQLLAENVSNSGPPSLDRSEKH